MLGTKPTADGKNSGRMTHFAFVKFSESEASNHTPSLVDFTTTTPELKFPVLTPRSPQSSGCPLQQSLIRNEIRDCIPSTSER